MSAEPSAPPASIPPTTIAAIATPPGRGAIAIVRCSGPGARAIGARVFQAREPLRDRVAVYGTVIGADGAVVDRGLALAMDAPRTATGEDTLELHVHGSPHAAGETLRALLHAGARLAEPGEFSKRAFLNGKLDLSAAEAVADLIDAESQAAARAAAANLAGGLARAIAGHRAALTAVLEELAGAIDYPDEVPNPDPTALATRIHEVAAALAALEADFQRGRLVREGMAVAIVGPPNAGKSSLLNALLEEDRAIVSPLAGTTRDAIEERLTLGGLDVRAIDTAGLRETSDPLEAAGIARAQTALATAAALVVVVDGSVPLDADARAVLAQTRLRQRLVLFSKADVGTVGYALREPAEADALAVSMHAAADVAEIRRALRALLVGDVAVDVGRAHLTRARQADAVARAREALLQAQATLVAQSPVDLIAGDLVDALAALGEVSGAAVNETIIAGIFARFCVGK